MPMPPKDPQDLDKVNFVIDMWTRPCEAPWYIYLETLKPAALTAFIVLISFGWADVLRGALRPKGLGRRSSKRKGRKGAVALRFPETGNTIGKKLPFGEQVSEWITWGTKTKFLWRIDNAMQAGLFMWLVADVLEDFVFDWTSLLYKTYWCRESHLGRFSWHGKVMANKSAYVWWKANYVWLDHQVAPPSWSGLVGSSGPNGCKVFATMTWEAFGGYPQPTNCGIKIYDSLSLHEYNVEQPPDQPTSGKISLVSKGDIPPNRLFRVAVYHEPSWASVGKGAIAAFENETH